MQEAWGQADLPWHWHIKEIPSDLPKEPSPLDLGLPASPGAVSLARSRR